MAAARKQDSTDRASDRGNGRPDHGKSDQDASAQPDLDLNKVRDILFGDHVRRLEETMERVEQDMAARFAALDTRIEGIESDVEARLQELSADGTQAETRTRESIETLRAELRAQFDAALAEARGATVNRSQMAALLGKLAGELTTGNEGQPDDPADD